MRVRTFFILILISLSINILVFSQAELDPNRYSFALKTYYQGILKLEEKKPEEALSLFNSCLEKLPSFADAYVQRGLSHYSAERYAAALSDFNQAIELYPQWRRIHEVIEQNKQLEDLKRTEAIQAKYAEAQEKAETWDGCSQRKYAKYAVSMGKDLEALRKQDKIKLSEIGIPANCYFHRGNCLQRLNRLPEAAQDYQTAIEIAGEYGEAHHNLAVVLFLTKQYISAQDHLDLARKQGAEINKEFAEALRAQRLEAKNQ